MPTIPTGRLERELRALYLRWVAGLSYDSKDLHGEIASFQRRADALISVMGGDIARRGALLGFPAPRLLELSPYAGTVYNLMEQAAIQAGIVAGISAKETAQAMFRAGMDKSYRRLERLARTETVRAYWKNAWDSIAGMPNLVMLWGSEDGPRTCAWCKERDGMVMDSPDLRDHPNGRCTPIPTLRSMVEYKGSVSRDGRIYYDPAWAKKDPFASARVAKDSDLPRTDRIGLTGEELEALQEYKSYAHSTINKNLDLGDITRVSKFTDPIDLAMDKGASYLKTDTLVSRGQSHQDFFERLNVGLSDDALSAAFPGGDLGALRRKIGTRHSNMEDYDLLSAIGREFEIPTYLSTSVAEETVGKYKNESIQMRVLVPKGTPSVFYDDDDDWEKELLLGRGLRYRLVGAVLRDGKWYVDLQVIR